MKAFLHLDGFVPAANTDAIRARLAGNATDHILLSGVESLPPGYWLEVTPEGTRRWQWWNTLDHLVRVPRISTTRLSNFGNYCWIPAHCGCVQTFLRGRAQWRTRLLFGALLAGAAKTPRH